MMPPGKLFVISTPIGNLKDITLRAIDTLKQVDVLACEDTRHTRKLLSHYGISIPKLISYHMHNEMASSNAIIDMLKKGLNVGLVSDAGTPGISDAGYLLISKVRQSGIEVISVPGPSAFVSCLVVSGLPSNNVLFVGFLPHKKGRKKKLREAHQSASIIGATVVFYESVHRLKKLLKEIEEEFGSAAQCAVCKELTKKFEAVFTGDICDLQTQLTDDTIQGEFVVCVYCGDKK